MVSLTLFARSFVRIDVLPSVPTTTSQRGGAGLLSSGDCARAVVDPACCTPGRRPGVSGWESSETVPSCPQELVPEIVRSQQARQTAVGENKALMESPSRTRRTSGASRQYSNINHFLGP